jgi:hypothetical protein
MADKPNFELEFWIELLFCTAILLCLFVFFNKQLN